MGIDFLYTFELLTKTKDMKNRVYHDQTEDYLTDGRVIIFFKADEVAADYSSEDFDFEVFKSKTDENITDILSDEEIEQVRETILEEFNENYKHNYPELLPDDMDRGCEKYHTNKDLSL